MAPKQLILLYIQYRKLQIELDNLTVRTWHRLIDNWIRAISLYFYFSLALALALALALIIMGLFAAVYFLPIFTMIILSLITLKKREMST